MELNLEARSLKVTTLLDPTALVGVEVPNGLSKAKLLITVGGRTVIAEVNEAGIAAQPKAPKVAAA